MIAALASQEAAMLSYAKQRNDEDIGRGAALQVEALGLGNCLRSDRRFDCMDQLRPVGVEHLASEATLAKALEGLKRELRDPYSAVFAELVTVSLDGDSIAYLCGTVNAKNAFGGYSGVTPFITSAQTGHTMRRDDSDMNQRTIWHYVRDLTCRDGQPATSGQP